MSDDEYRFSREDHDLLVELNVLAAELRIIAKPRSLYHRVRFWAALAAAMTFNLGLVLMVGGPGRVGASAYWGIATYGGPIVWGAAFVAASAITGLCIWRWHRALRWALLLQALPYAAISASFAVAAVKYPDANLTATPIYGWICVFHAALSDYARKEF